MRFSNSFSNYDPLIGEIPPHYTDEFKAIAQPSRRILKRKRRTRSQYEFLIQFIDRIIIQGELDFGDSMKKEKTVVISPARLLEKAVGKGGLSELKELPDVTWAELFAVLAIAHIGLAFENPIGAIGKKGADLESHILEFMGELAADGLEATKMAQRLTLKEEFEENARAKAKEIVGNQNRSASAQRKDRKLQRELKREFIDFYESGSFASIRKAIDQFEIKLAQDPERLDFLYNNKIISPGNFDRFFRKALNDYKK